MTFYDLRAVYAHGDTSAKVYLMNEAPGPREAVSGVPLFGDQGGNLFRALRRVNVTWAKDFNQGMAFSWPKYDADHYKNNAGRKKVSLRRAFLEVRGRYITCSNAFDRWPKTSRGADDWVAPSDIELRSTGNELRLRGEISSVHTVLLICGSCSWQAIFHQSLQHANARIGYKLNACELSIANTNLSASFREAFYMGHTSKCGRQ